MCADGCGRTGNGAGGRGRNGCGGPLIPAAIPDSIWVADGNVEAVMLLLIPLVRSVQALKP